jgi:DNA-binding MarR family transcriptional regulator
MKYDESTQFIESEDEDQDLWMFLNRTRHMIFRARQLELRRYRITPEQADLLSLVQAMDNKATPTALSRDLLKQPHSTGELVNRMAKSGLIKRVKDQDRENLVKVSITQKGLEAYKQSAKRGPIHRIMGKLTPEEKNEFRQYLGKICHQARQELGMDTD